MSQFEIAQNFQSEAVIRVVGVGGCGGNAVDHMIQGGVKDVQFISVNTDIQALKKNGSDKKVQIGTDLTKGLGAGANPEIGREAAQESMDEISNMLDGADMVFITAGMGGGTGTGAAPVIAEMAKQKGILTVGVVTRPFAFEGKRQKAAQAGIDELQKHVDSLIIIPNDKLMQVLGDDISFKDAFKAADDVLKNAVSGISDIINNPGLINVDFADVKSVMSDMGMAMMGTAEADGRERAVIAAENAVSCPLLDNGGLSGAKGILVNIISGHDLKMKEVHEIMAIIQSHADEDAKIIFGTAFDESLNGKIRVTVVATGLGDAVQKTQPVSQKLTLVKTGTDDMPVEIDYDAMDTPSVWRNTRNRGVAQTTRVSQPDAVSKMDMTIPAFLRKQAD